MQVQNLPQQNSFNGALIIARVPQKVCNASDVIVNKSGRYFPVSIREIVNLDNGTRINKITKTQLPADSFIKYVENNSGDIYKTFKQPIYTSKSNDAEIKRVANQIAIDMNVPLRQDQKIGDLIKTIKTTGLLKKITISDDKARRFLSRIEDIIGQKIEVKPEQPKYFINTNNKIFFVADYAKGAEDCGTVIKYMI